MLLRNSILNAHVEYYTIEEFEEKCWDDHLRRVPTSAHPPAENSLNGFEPAFPSTDFPSKRSPNMSIYKKDQQLHTPG